LCSNASYLALIESHGTLAHELFMNLHRAPNVIALRILVHRAVVYPAVSMRRHFPIRSFLESATDGWIALECLNREPRMMHQYTRIGLASELDILFNDCVCAQTQAPIAYESIPRTMPTAKTVHGTFRDVNRRCSLQKPERDP
jgi:hypothetical protein